MTAKKLLNTADFFSFSSVSDDPAVKLLSSLSQEQRIIVCYPLDHISKSQWHFLPGSMEPRAGIQLSALNDQQKKMVYNLLQSSLSETGYTKTLKIIDLENVLLEMSGNSKMRDPEKYSVAFYGNPQKDSLWAWSFEGHHLSLNFTVFNGVTSIAPQFLGASPATILSGDRKGQRTLEREEDLGLELINSLSKAQQRIAIFQEKPIYNIFTGNSREVGPLTPVGISYGALNRTQQSTFLKLINEYISSMPVEVAERRMEKIRNEEMDEVMFGWAGAISAGEGHYYRIQGSSFLIEFDNSTDHANHIHTVWRDFAGDFGRNLIREHHNKSHHH